MRLRQRIIWDLNMTKVRACVERMAMLDPRGEMSEFGDRVISPRRSLPIGNILW